MMQDGNKLSRNNPSEKITILKFLHLKSTIFLKKIILFTIFQLGLRYFVVKIILVLNNLAWNVFSPNR